ncbi:MAG: DUF1059 domain-containing protein [Nanoarchaeota archaeon]|nr:DUF1059 domain-containing protein [Nanoarchaeota archaeon]MEC8339714.1 DUF1059 domain-containing protein [Nanoarchaeota archaeon]
MKVMTCKQLGGACEKEFRANSFEELSILVQQHGMEMFQKQDEDHMEAMMKIQALMQKPQEMQVWMDEKRALFESLPDVE